MKRILTACTAVALFCAVGPASAWMYWYHLPSPYAPTQSWYLNLPGMYLYNQIPSALPQTWRWNLPAPTSGLYVEQGQTPTGYVYRVYAPGQRLQDIKISVETGVLAMRRTGSTPSVTQGPFVLQRFGDFSQWRVLPPDANPSAMRVYPRNGALEIIIPRRY